MFFSRSAMYIQAPNSVEEKKTDVVKIISTQTSLLQLTELI